MENADSASSQSAVFSAAVSGDASARGRFRFPVVPSSLIIIAASVFTTANLVPPFSASGYLTLLGCVISGLLSLSVCLSLAEMRSTAPNKSGVWYFARMLIGARLCFVSLWLELFGTAALGVLFLRTLFKIIRPEYLVNVHFTADSWLWLFICMAAGIPAASAVLFVIGKNFPARINSAFEWGKSIKWISFILLSGGWGISVCALFFHDNPFSAPYGKLLSTTEIAGCLFRGILLGLACFASIPHCIPACGQASGAATEEAVSESYRYRIPREIILAVLLVILSSVFLTAALLGTGGDGISSRFALLLLLASYVAIAAGFVYTIDKCCRTIGLMAREGLLPRWFNSGFSPGNQSFNGPVTFLLYAGLYYASRDISAAFILAGLFQAFFGALTCFCQIWQRSDAGDETFYGFVMPGYFWAPASTIGMLLVIGLVPFFVPATFHVVFPVVVFCIAAGFVFFEFYGRFHSLAHTDDVFTIDEDDEDKSSKSKSLHRGTLSILVADDRIEDSYPLLGIAEMLAAGRRKWISHLNLIKIPDEMTRANAMRSMVDARKTSDAVLDWGRSHEITIHTKIRLSKTASRGILTTLRETRTDFLVLSQKHPVKVHDTPAWGHTTDAVMRRAGCNVLISGRTGEGLPYNRILVPIVDLEQSLFAFWTAVSIFRGRENVRITLFDPRGGISLKGPETIRFRKAAAKVNSSENLSVEIHDDFCGSIVDGVLEEIIRGDHQLIFLGVPPPLQIRVVSGEEDPEPQIAGRCRIPFIAVCGKTIPTWKGIFAPHG